MENNLRENKKTGLLVKGQVNLMGDIAQIISCVIALIGLFLK